MRLPLSLYHAALLLCASTTALAASSWSFSDATVSVQGKGAGVGGGFKEKLNPTQILSKPVNLGVSDTLKIILTAQDGKSAKQPHQAFLLLQDSQSGLDISYPFSVKDSGKAKVDLTQKDIPVQLLQSSNPIDAQIVIASFGTSQGYKSKAFSLSVELDPNVPLVGAEKAERYGKLPEIHHFFRADPKSPNIVITLVFTAAVLATLPILLGSWLYLGGNVNQVSKAFRDAPVSHGLFIGSIGGMEFLFFLYYTSWNLFQTLPVLGVIAVVAYFSGSRALTEVQGRRLAGLR